MVGRHDCRVVCKCGGWQAEKSSSDGAGADVSYACLVGAPWFWVLVVVAAWL